MNFRYFIWISSVALIIFISVQYHIISETFQTKRQQFDSKYSGLAKLGMYEFENEFFFRYTDSLFNAIDEYAYNVLYNTGLAVMHEIPDSMFNMVNSHVRESILPAPMGRRYLEEYFNASGEPTSFTPAKVIRNITLIPYGQQLTFFNDTSFAPPENMPQALKIRTYTIERNNFRLSFDYYLGFPERSDRILNEMRFTLLLALLSLLIVFAAFFLTLRNLLIQKRLSDMKTDFINNMTHELKTPLSTISVASSSLALKPEQHDRERIREISDTINRQNRHLTKLIDKILDISIWEKDQVRLEKKPVDIVRLVKDIAANFSPGNEFSYTLHAEVSSTRMVPMDEIHFTTVINNLLSNAVKYGGAPPKAEIRVKTGDVLLISVTDNGKGISREDLKHIFEKFFRSKTVKKDAIKGLGLGLYYVKQIVEAHGGTVRAESQQDRGTTFTIEIPLDHEYTAG